MFGFKKRKLRYDTYLAVHMAYKRDTGRDLESFFDFVGLSSSERQDLIGALMASEGENLRSADRQTKHAAEQRSLDYIMTWPKVARRLDEMSR